MTNVSVDEKGPLWWIGAFIWGYVALLTVISLSRFIDLFDFRLFLAALAFGFVLGIPAWLRWRSGGFRKKPPEPLSVEFVDTPDEGGVYSFRFVGKQKTKVGPGLKVVTVSFATYAFWWFFVRGPVLIGDWLLSSVFGWFDRAAPSGLLGVKRLPGFGAREPSILQRARDEGLLHEDEDPTRPNPAENTF
ncbi:MAG: hypothetical protein OEM67_03385 [Thermoleophilia bacterium]|nr:hypothetical protein [Thermoleophilia bacterium]